MSQNEQPHKKDLMGDMTPLQEALPAMLSTQLLAADVYTTFMEYSENDESTLWHTMLHQELGHIRFIAMLMDTETVPDIMLPPVRMEAFRELCNKAREYAPNSAFERTLWALRLEHAQIDFGVESLATRTVGRSPGTPVYPGPVETHYAQLLNWAERYRGAREIAMQIARIEEHLPQLGSNE